MPILIAHRGNTEGPKKEYENLPARVSSILSTYDWLHCEIDVWLTNGEWYLGHDRPSYKVNESFLITPRLWCHAKNLAALGAMLNNQNIHCFWHEEDKFTLTSKGYIWTYPDQPLIEKSICVMPENYTILPTLETCAGVCSDFIST